MLCSDKLGLSSANWKSTEISVALNKISLIEHYIEHEDFIMNIFKY